MALFLTRELALRVEGAEIDNYVARLEGLARLPGDPAGIAIRRLDDATLLKATERRGDLWFNRAMGRIEAGQIPEIAAWYGNVLHRFDVVPQLADEALLGALDRHDYYAFEFFSVLYTQSEASAGGETDLAVIEVRADDLDSWVEDYMAAFDIPLEERERQRAQIRLQYDHPGFRYYLARLNDEPAAIAALFVKGSVASLAAAATVPKFRGCGLQSALIRRRLSDAAAMGCTLIVSQAEVGEVSQRNLERAGLRLAYTKAFWKPRGGRA